MSDSNILANYNWMISDAQFELDSHVWKDVLHSIVSLYINVRSWVARWPHSALVHGSSGLGLSPGRDIVLCSWARHLTLTVPLFTQQYKWIPVICWGNLTKCWGVTCDGLASRPGGVEILLAASCYGNRDKLQPDGPVGSIRLHFTHILFCHGYHAAI